MTDGALFGVQTMLSLQVGLTGDQLKFLPKTSLTEHLQVASFAAVASAVALLYARFFVNRLPLSSVS